MIKEQTTPFKSNYKSIISNNLKSDNLINLKTQMITENTDISNRINLRSKSCNNLLSDKSIILESLNVKPIIPKCKSQLVKNGQIEELTEEEIKLIENLSNLKIDKTIGYGGFSIIKKAVSSNSNKTYALKIVSVKFYYL